MPRSLGRILTNRRAAYAKRIEQPIRHSPELLRGLRSSRGLQDVSTPNERVGNAPTILDLLQYLKAFAVAGGCRGLVAQCGLETCHVMEFRPQNPLVTHGTRDYQALAQPLAREIPIACTLRKHAKISTCHGNAATVTDFAAHEQTLSIALTWNTACSSVSSKP
jgi:hypothetical protein